MKSKYKLKLYTIRQISSNLIADKKKNCYFITVSDTQNSTYFRNTFNSVQMQITKFNNLLLILKHALKISTTHLVM